MKLRPYQEKALDSIAQEYRKGHRHILVVSPTASGKGHVLAHLIKRAMQKGSEVLFLVHLREIVDQVSEKLDGLLVKNGVIMAGEVHDIRHKVSVASIQTIARRIEHKEYPKADLIVVDECFPAGTIVSPNLPIESIQEGDIVHAYNEETGALAERRVVRTFRNKMPEGLVRVRAGAYNVVCTKNHPFFTKGGWVEAQHLTGEDYVYCEMRVVRNRVCVGEESSERSVLFNKKGLLQARVLKSLYVDEIKRNNGQHEQKVCLCSDEDEQSNEQSRSKSKDGENPSGKKPQAEGKRGEWEWPNRTTGDTAGADSGIITRIQRKVFGDEGSRVLSLLQNRLSSSRKPVSNRSGREQPLRDQASSTRREKGRVLAWQRVDGIEIQKQGGHSEPGSSGRGDYVYNIEVEGLHTYVANGIVVHNCHRAVSRKYQKVINYFKKNLVVGFTATPCRKTGNGLGTFFDTLINAATIQELTAQGYLVPVVYFAPSEPDLKKVKVAKGDYVERQLESVMMNGGLIGDIVATWIKLGENRQTMMFTTTVAHSIAACQAFNDVGIPAEHVDGKTDKSKRKEILDRFRKKEVRVLVNCAVYTEGVDIPDVSCVVCAKPTKALANYMQMVGRGMRLAEGKKDLRFIDHAGVCYEHGPVHEITHWTLDTEVRNVNEKNELRKKEEKRPITCPKCQRVYTGQLKCPECGNIPDIKQFGKEVAWIDGDLGEVCFKTRTVKKEVAFDKEKFYYELCGYAKEKNFASGWAWHKFRERFAGENPAYPKGFDLPPSPETQRWIRGQMIRKSYQDKARRKYAK